MGNRNKNKDPTTGHGKGHGGRKLLLCLNVSTCTRIVIARSKRHTMLAVEIHDVVKYFNWKSSSPWVPPNCLGMVVPKEEDILEILLAMTVTPLRK
jgi:hypothetical protein